jgi:hypothetical protein
MRVACVSSLAAPLVARELKVTGLKRANVGEHFVRLGAAVLPIGPVAFARPRTAYQQTLTIVIRGPRPLCLERASEALPHSHLG